MLKNKNTYLFIGTIGIIITGFLMTNGIQHYVDIVFLDETSYLIRGSKMFGKIPKRWGPMYCAWYRVLMFFQSDLLKLYFLNFKLMAMIPSALLFLTLSRYSKVTILNLLISLGFLVSIFNLPIYPRVSFFCISIILVALFISSYLKDIFLKGLLFISMALLISYVRPEFYLTIILLLLTLATMFVFKTITYKKQYTLPIIVFLVAATILHLGLGNPLLIKLNGFNRSIIAFGEHFAYNYSQWNNIDLYLWLEWRDIFVQNFGDVNSLTDAIHNNFPMFWKHVYTNIIGFIYALTNLFTSFILPFKLSKTASLIIGLIIMVIALISFIRYFKKVINYEMLFLLVFAIPTLISCILVFPRNHYMVLIVPFISLILVRIINPMIKEENNSITLVGVILLSVLFISFGPRIDDFKYWKHDVKVNGVVNNIMALEILNIIDPNEEVRMLTSEGDLTPFLKINVDFVIPKEKKGVDFYTFLEQQNPDIIYVTNLMLFNPYFARDSTWQAFLTDYEAHGFNKKLLGDEINEFFLVSDEFSNYFD